MLQSLAALPLSALGVALLYVLLRRITPLGAVRAATVAALASLGLLAVGAVFSRPGADVIAMYVAVLAVTAYLLGIVGAGRERQHDRDGGRTHWGPVLIVAFFAVLFAADGLFVLISREGPPAQIARWLLPGKSAEPGVRSVFPGTVARDYQNREGQYDRYLQRMETQAARGWRVRKGWLGDAVAGRPASFQVAVEDSEGEPVTGASISGTFRRPSDSRLDLAFALREREAGIYRAEIALPEPGRWDLSLAIARGDDLHELQARTSVAAPAETGR